jgi:hypothetical protein
MVLVKLIFQYFSSAEIFLRLGSGWPFFFEIILFLGKFNHSLFKGVLQDHESLLLVLELGGEVISLSLESSNLTLVHGTTHS